VALEGYLNFSAALAGGSLDNRIREQIAIAVAESNLCRYCLSAHAFLAEKAGLSPEEIASAVRASSSDPRTDAVLKLARAIIVQRGEVNDAELERARAAGLTDGELDDGVPFGLLSVNLSTAWSAQRLAIQTQGRDARGECRRLHAKQLCRTAWSRELAICLLHGGHDGVSLLTLQLLARERRLRCGWLSIFGRILGFPRGGDIKSQWTFLP